MLFSPRLRHFYIGWLYFMSLVHFVVGVLMAWGSGWELFKTYHQQVLNSFGAAEIGTSLNDVHLWWFNLFGATLQNLAILLAVLIYFANRYKNAAMWMWIVIGFLVWAPQDIVISLKIQLWLNVWVDLAALVLMVPPLLGLWWQDRLKN